MNRSQLQKLAGIRLTESTALLEKGMWSGAYYLSGYVIECGLKACLLRHLGESGAVFAEPSYLRRLADCWTHDLVKLVNLAGLDEAFGLARAANPGLDAFWTVTKDWKETARYEEKTEAKARVLYEAVSHDKDGVFRWIQSRW